MRLGSVSGWRELGLGVLYLGFAFAVPFALNAKASDLDVFFWPAAELAAHGHPLAVYTIQAGPYPNANGPLALVPLTLVALLANALGWASDAQLRDALTLVVFSGFTLLMAREAVRLLGMRPADRRVPAVCVALCLSVPLWLALGSFGHVEIPLELWLALVALRLTLRGRPVPAGAMLGLAVLARSTALVLVLCLALLVVADRRMPSLARRGLRSLGLIGAAGVTALAGLLPFLLSGSRDVFSSLVSFRAGLPISGGSVWVLLARGLPWAGVVQRYDTLILAGVGLALMALALWRARGQPLDARRAAGLLTLASSCVPLLAKTTWAYYLAEPCAFAIVWTVSQTSSAASRPWVVPLLLSLVSVVLAMTGLSTPPTATQVVVGVVATALIAVAMAPVMRDVMRSPRWAMRQRAGGDADPESVAGIA